jgi:tRNA(adenine34) deaminase
MNLAVEQAHFGKTPFGAVLIDSTGVVIAKTFNTVASPPDPTAHAEINVLRAAAARLNTKKLTGTVLYTTGEPCPMCMSGIIFAGVNKVIYGASIPIISRYLFQVDLRAEEVIERSGKEMVLKGGIQEADCEELLKKYT